MLWELLGCWVLGVIGVCLLVGAFLHSGGSWSDTDEEDCEC